jgi:hypothetical protein
MPSIVHTTVAAFLAGAAIAFWVLLLSWPRRDAPGGKALVAMMAGVCAWAIPAALELLMPTLDMKIHMSQLSYLGIVSTPLLYFVFTLQVGSPGLLLRPSTFISLATPAAGFFVLALTNSWHRLLWTSFRLDTSTGIMYYGHGPVFYGLFGYLFATAVTASMLLGARYFAAPTPFRLQGLSILGAAALPLATSFLYAIGRSPLPGVDLTPAAFGVAGLLLGVGLTRLRVLDFVPVAKNLVFERMSDGIIVLDERRRVVDANLAAQVVLGAVAIRIGQPVGPPLSAWLDVEVDHASHDGSKHVEAIGSRFVEITTSIIPVRGPGSGGTVVLLRDVTRRHVAEQQLEHAEASLRDRVAELEQALGEVRTLQGMLPICAYCKRIRNDDNYWQQIESYVSAHSRVRFSHGICPDCLSKVEAELDAELPPDRPPARRP